LTLLTIFVLLYKAALDLYLSCKNSRSLGISCLLYEG
jgi:hypothetical protein